MTIDASSPAELLRISGSYWPTCALHAGAMLDVFTPLDGGPASAASLAPSLACDARALTMLLNALAAMGLVTKDGDAYALSDAARRFLVKTSPDYVGYIIRHHHRLMPSWAQLPDAVRSGKPVRGRGGSGDGREDFLLGMYNLASAIAPRLAKCIDLTGRERFLDLGGGPGTYAVHFCLANPGLQASVFDLDTSEAFARTIAARHGVADRIGFIPGDYLQDPVPGGFDVAWLSHILHAEDPAGCRTIIGKAAKALKPGGLVFIHEFILNDTMDGPEFPALFSLNMLLGTAGGQSYSEAQLRGMLEEAGFRDVRRLDFKGPNDSGVLRAVAG
ncbi:acetylserotonin O-methyltransferase [Fundidesulfovibrio terrae]|uniref:acetylserotonin O-methyltransferase n=1 Tax=Fundidesulfovibrio terrae TaxID=2922866 RepID=UPI001FAE972F|nr:acetylserotonin O-methyltransferase [Fundidesulfovibrio terrae]